MSTLIVFVNVHEELTALHKYDKEPNKHSYNKKISFAVM